MIWGEPNRQPNFAIGVPADPSASSLTPAQAKRPEVYAQLLDAADGALKAVNPNNLVIGGSTYTNVDGSTEQWIDYMRLPYGLPPRVDAYGHNPFSWRPLDISWGSVGNTYIGSDMLWQMDPGALIRDRRRANGLTQQRLALRAGSTQAAISRLERGELSPTFETFERLLAVMGEEADLEIRRVHGDYDLARLASLRQRAPAQRLALAISWNRLAARFAQEGARALGEHDDGPGAPTLGNSP
jgi:transcriptional regulator with XRE-family HTH domain